MLHRWQEPEGGGEAELIKFIINTISHSLGFRSSIGLSFVRYKNKTTSSDVLYVEITSFVVGQVTFCHHKLSDLLTQLTRLWWFCYII